ncbi:MAG: DUF1553 domain-containing protein [Planctomycetaceae bacterium]|jgi:mono/diheme cytochrome c family protein|nr:DUF1553 domain-containing protein [Planctomycetaceae bacterium]
MMIVLLGVIAKFSLAQAPESLVVRWDFESEETSKLRLVGTVHRDIPGPRAPLYPDFDANNTAVKLDGNGGHLEFDDPGTQSDFDFGNEDAMTLEAWVQAESLRPGEFVYILGKGRTTASGPLSDNQNWALRIREKNQQGCVSFLFATPKIPSDATKDSHWHRWTSTNGFVPGKLWHHVAVSYRFGHPDSIRCWIDGKSMQGDWDMGGRTTLAPVVDNDAIWIGSSRGGAPGNSFRGSLDSIAIHRKLFDDSQMVARYKTTDVERPAKLAIEFMPTLDVPAKGVLMTLHEGLPSHTRWLNEGEAFPETTMQMVLESMLLDRLPQRFDDWGIRSVWTDPVLVRLAADIELPAGPQTLLMRVRGTSRLWCNGTLVARSKTLTGSPSGEEPMTPVTSGPFPQTRVAEHRQQQVQADIDVPADGKVRIVLETIVGGKGFRTDPGETCVGWIDKQSQLLKLVSSGAGSAWIPYDDLNIVPALDRVEKQMQQADRELRRKLASSQDSFWEKRHAMAKQWAEDHVVKVPDNRGASDRHPIDAFLDAKIQVALQHMSKKDDELDQQRQASVGLYREKIQPLLAQRCGRCHLDGLQGGLSLVDLQSMLAGGDSAEPAVVPGNPQQSLIIRRVLADDAHERMPPGGQRLSPEEIESLTNWIASGAAWRQEPIDEKQIRPSALLDDASFLRKASFDLIGLPPTEQDLDDFLADTRHDKRRRVVDKLLDDPRWADASMGYWQDVLAENPTLINASLNTTGPFRWFLYDAFCDNKPVDRWVSELVLMRGSVHEGGSAGFGLAGDNDAPQAAKAQILASAFLGIETQCARCHDSPYHHSTQKDLFSIASMIEQKPLTVPRSSRVPDAFFANKTREPLIRVTLDFNKPVEPAWPWPDLFDELPDTHGSTREQLATYLTVPQNRRFAKVFVNRLWRRLMGAGIVEPPGDWQSAKASHPELLDWLANELLRSEYDCKAIIRLIATSEAYQRQAIGSNRKSSSERRFFASPDPRRLEAEQIVDALVHCSGRVMDVEELTFDPDARRPSSNRLTLGVPRRAWMFANLANERDRPSLNLPRAQAIADLLLVFGWNGARQNARTDRESSANALQPGMMSNSITSGHLIRAVRGGDLAALAIEARSPEELVKQIYKRYLGRLPREAELVQFREILSAGFNDRIVQHFAIAQPSDSFPRVTWSNHLRPEANEISIELEKLAREGPEVDPRLEKDWRERYEDVLWCIINTDEFVWLP